MPKRYWFEPKKYGWGFVPNTQEGWLATLVLLILLLIVLQTNGVFTSVITATGLLRLLFDIFVLGVIFTVTLQGKVRGGLKWRWNGHRKRRRRRR